MSVLLFTEGVIIGTLYHFQVSATADRMSILLFTEGVIIGTLYHFEISATADRMSVLLFKEGVIIGTLYHFQVSATADRMSPILLHTEGASLKLQCDSINYRVVDHTQGRPLFINAQQLCVSCACVSG
jgi:hypothetical protein